MYIVILFYTNFDVFYYYFACVLCLLSGFGLMQSLVVGCFVSFILGVYGLA